MSDKTTTVAGLEFSEDAINAMIAGENISGSVDQDGNPKKSFVNSNGSEVKEIRSSVPISGYGTNLRPSVGREPGAELVSRPQMADINQRHDERCAKEEAERQEQLEALRVIQERVEGSALVAELDALSSRLSFLERAHKRMTKQLKENK